MNGDKRYPDSPDPPSPEPRRGTRPSPEQKAARADAAEARRSELERKRRTRSLIEMGGVCSAFGFSDPAQVEAILSALTRSRRGPDRLRELGVRETARWPSGSGSGK